MRLFLATAILSIATLALGNDFKIITEEPEFTTDSRMQSDGERPTTTCEAGAKIEYVTERDNFEFTSSWWINDLLGMPKKRLRGRSWSAETLQRALMRTTCSVERDSKSGHRFLSATLMSPKAREIYRTCGLKWDRIGREPT